MGGRHNLVFGQSLKVSSPTSTLSPSLYVSEIYREGESVLVGLLTLRDRPKTRLCRPPIQECFILPPSIIGSCTPPAQKVTMARAAGGLCIAKFSSQNINPT